MKQIDRTFSVAPMMDWTDRHCRYLHRLISKNVLLYTEMVTAPALIHGDADRLLEFNQAEHSIALQIGGSDPYQLAQATRLGCDAGYDEININIGCPSDRVQSGRFGACLMLEPNHVAECLSAMQDNASIPVSIKCRLGIDDHEEYEFLYNFVEIVKNSGINHFIIHARNGILKGLSPRQNRHIPPLKYDYVYQLKKDFPELDIVINGGIKTITDCHEHLRHVDGVMIGRAAYENPFLIQDIDSQIYGEPDSKKSKKIILNQYLDYVEEKLNQGHDLSRMMKHLFGLSRGDKYAKTFRIKILEVIKKESIGAHRQELEDLLFY